jgi:hypothetical protein
MSGVEPELQEEPPPSAYGLRAAGCVLVFFLALGSLWSFLQSTGEPAPALVPRLELALDSMNPPQGAVVRVASNTVPLPHTVVGAESGEIAPAGWRGQGGWGHVGEEGRGWAYAVRRDPATQDLLVIFEADGQPARAFRVSARAADGSPLVFSEGLTGIGTIVPTPRWKRWYVDVFGGNVTLAGRGSPPPPPTLVVTFQAP